MADPTPASTAASLSTVTSPGWKTTEMWLTTVLLAGLGTVIEQLIQVLPELTKSYPQAAIAIPVAVALLGAAGAWAKAQYTKQRGLLKLATTAPDSPDAAAKVLS